MPALILNAYNFFKIQLIQLLTRFFLDNDPFIIIEVTLNGFIKIVFSPELTWRDVQHLIARSSKPLAPRVLATRSSRRPTPHWTENAANLSGKSVYAMFSIFFCLFVFCLLKVAKKTICTGIEGQFKSK